MATEPTPYNEEDEISVKELILNIQEWIRYLRSKWRILLAVGILGGIVGLGYALWKKPSYTATTTFVLEDGEGQSGLSQYAGVAAMVGIDLGGGGSGLFEGGNILELYKSRTMLEQTLLSQVYPDSAELLIERYIAFNDVKDDWESEPLLYSLDFRTPPTELKTASRRLRDSVITEFVNTINEKVLRVSKPDKQLSIIKVEVTSKDEVFSKAFNDNLVRRVNDFYIQTKTKQSTNNIHILETKVDSIKSIMEAAIFSAAKVSDATPNINPTRQAQRIVPTQEAQFSAETNKVILGQLLQNLELAKLSQLQEQPLIQMVDRPVYPLEVDKLGKGKAIIIGGFLAGFLGLLFFIIMRWYKDVMGEEHSRSGWRRPS